jgi:AcrR family transcriptional regulator
MLEAALDLFSAHGYAGVCTKAIAQAAGVNEVTLFRSFGSKRELYIEVFRTYAVRPEELGLPKEFGGNLDEEILDLGYLLAAFFLRNDKIVRLSFKDLENFPEILVQLRSGPAIIGAGLAAWFGRVGEGLALAASPQDLASTFLNAITGTTIHLSRIADEEAVMAFVRSFCPVFSRGMAAPGA